jgi:hypothetical protein
VSCLLQESFKNAEKQEVPAAEKLEAVARIEIFRCMDDLQEASKVRTYIHTYIPHLWTGLNVCLYAGAGHGQTGGMYVCCPDRLLSRRS